MNKFIELIVSNLQNIIKQNILNIIAFYNRTVFKINKNSAIAKLYKPIIDEKTIANKSLKQTLNDIYIKNREAENNIAKLQKENTAIEDKITIIQNILTKRYD